MHEIICVKNVCNNNNLLINIKILTFQIANPSYKRG